MSRPRRIPATGRKREQVPVIDAIQRPDRPDLTLIRGALAASVVEISGVVGKPSIAGRGVVIRNEDLSAVVETARSLGAVVLAAVERPDGAVEYPLPASHRPAVAVLDSILGPTTVLAIRHDSQGDSQ